MKSFSDVTKILLLYVIICILVIGFFVWGNANIVNKAIEPYIHGCLGGVLGGVGGLLALYVTNKRRQEQVTQQQQNERIHFVNEIAKEIGIFITNDSDYWYTEFTQFSETYNRCPDRTKAVEIYYTLQTQLHGIDSAKQLLIEIDNLHKGEGRDFPWVQSQADKIKDELNKFKAAYVKGE